jgi:hypothetical protein
VRGEPVDPDELIRLTNTARRTLAGIRRKEQPKPSWLSTWRSGVPAREYHRHHQDEELFARWFKNKATGKRGSPSSLPCSVSP